MSWPYDHDRVGKPLAQKDPASPATTSIAWDTMAPRWMMIDTVLAGTEAMREVATLYMPQHSAESPVSYQSRLSRATLTNYTELTLDHLCGKPFAEKIKVLDDVPQEIKDLMEDVDLEGTELDTFCQNWFRTALAKGFAHVLVDMPVLPELPEGQVRTLEDDRNSKSRPYFVIIPPENVINASSSMVNGKEMLTRVVLREQEIVQDGFAEKVVDQIRVMTPGHVQTWHMKDKKQSDQKDVWEIVGEQDTSLDVIPLVTFYTKRDGFMLSKPPLLDLCYLNIAHWQSASDQRNILTVARFPILAVSGASEEEQIIKVGPNQILMTSDPNGKFYYVEHAGTAIEAGVNDLHDLEIQMTAYGAEFLKEQPDRNTATSRALDSAESLSPLAKMVVAFVGSVSTALGFMTQWMGLGEQGGHIEIDKAFNLDETTQWEIVSLQAARASRDISRKAFLTELQRRRILNQEYDIEGDVDQIEQETAQGLGPPTGGDLNPMDLAKIDQIENPPPSPGGGTKEPAGGQKPVLIGKQPGETHKQKAKAGRV